MAKREWAFIGLAFGISWSIEISAVALGAGPDAGLYVVSFGVSGPAVAAILLSRSGRKSAVRPSLGWFVLFWLSASAVYVTNDRMRGFQASSHAYYPLVVLLAAIPAAILSGAFTKDTGVRKLLQTLIYRRNWRWQAVAFLFFPMMLLIPALIVRPFGATIVWPERHGSLASFVLYGAILFLDSLLFTAVLEEPGWRGFLLARLEGRFSPLFASLLVWLPWVLHHGVFDADRLRLGMWTWPQYVQIRVIYFIPVTIIMTWLFNRSGGDILAAAIFHAGMNTFPFVMPYAPKMLALIFIWAAYVVVADRMWRRQHEPAAQITGDAAPSEVLP